MKFLFTKTIPINQIPYKNLLKFTDSHRVFSSKIIPGQVPISVNRDIMVRTMTKEDLSIALQWAKKENWNPGLYELEALYAADPEGYKMLWVDGEPVASLAAIKYSKHYAFFGLYIVVPQFRGQGYGKLLWDISMKTVVPCGGVALNSVMDQIETYKRSEFYFSNLNTRWSSGLFNPILNQINIDPEISLVKEISLDDVVNLDFQANATYRPLFWSKALSKKGSYFLAAQDNYTIQGFGLLSACVDGYKFGPIYANTEKIAEDLVLNLWKYVQSIDSNKEAKIQIDTTENNPQAQRLAEKFGFNKAFNTARMYKGVKPNMGEQAIYGLTSLEIG